MQYLMLIKINNADYEAGKPPPAELQDAMGGLMGEWAKEGIMVTAAGLSAPSKGARVRLNAGNIVVSDGPFAETKEVVGGYFVLNLPDKAAAIAQTKRFVELHRQVLGDDFVLECELRELEA